MMEVRIPYVELERRTPEEFVDYWLMQMGGAMGRGGRKGGGYEIALVRPCCEELVRLGDCINNF